MMVPAISAAALTVSLSLSIALSVSPVWSQEFNRPSDAAGTDRPALNVDVRLPATRGNPLWGLTLDALPTTAERPIFSPSRRPPVVATVLPPQISLPIVAGQSLQPALSLLGVIAAEAGDTQSVAVFLDVSANAVIRMKPGEAHTGWTLQSVGARHAVLQRGRDTATLVLSNASAK